MKERNDAGEKSKYSKPRLRTIELATDEVLAVGCKTNKSGFNVNSSPCMANNCSKQGS